MAKKSATKVGRPKKTPTKKKVTAAKRSRKPTQKEEQRDNCFVMMPFSNPFNIYYERLYRPAIEDAGLEPIRADDLFRPGVIVSDLWAMIQEAKVLLAELTTKNANVYYELGLAHAIGKPIVLVSETLDDVPFDLQQLRVLLYNKDDPTWGEKLVADITTSIKETLEEPIEAVPNIFRKRVESQGPEQDALTLRLEALETQIRNLRQRPRRERLFGGTNIDLAVAGAEMDLKSVSYSDEFEKWVRRWSKKLPSSRLQYITKKSMTTPDSPIPPGEAKRIPEIIRKHGKDTD